jgi:hypothetical protein
LQGDEDLSLWKKGKNKVDKGARQGPKFGAMPQGESSSGKKRDMLKVNLFVCKKMGHYVGQCPNMNNKKGSMTNTTEEEKFRTLFERECVFLICFTSIQIAPSIWYIHNGASSDMNGVRENLNDLRDIEVRMNISISDDTLVIDVGIDIVTFERDDMPPSSFMDVLYVPRMKNNMISVSTLQDRGL